MWLLNWLDYLFLGSLVARATFFLGNLVAQTTFISDSLVMVAQTLKPLLQTRNNILHVTGLLYRIKNGSHSVCDGLV